MAVRARNSCFPHTRIAFVESTAVNVYSHRTEGFRTRKGSAIGAQTRDLAVEDCVCYDPAWRVRSGPAADMQSAS